MTLGSRAFGLLDSLRRAAGTGVDLVHTRVELFGVELEQELMRAIRLMIHGISTLLLAVFAIVFIGFAVIVVFWDTHRELAALLVAGFFALLALVAAILLQRALKRPHRPFNSTLEVLEDDAAALRGER
jgi:uncharacterized membrane protein YqjE